MIFAVILSGGIGSRMKLATIPKQYIEVNEMPILAYTLMPFQESTLIDKIVIVAAKEWHNYIYDLKERYHITKLNSDIALAGSNRQESILNGLEKCMYSSECSEDIVVIHDAVRPFVSPSLIRECIHTIREGYDGCMPVLPVKDTIYQSDNGIEISHLLDREMLYAGQSPEAFSLQKYYEINNSLSRDMLSLIRGSSEIAFKYGLKVKLIPGNENNYKITTPEDLERFKTNIGVKL